jgi:hypothetical protein
MNWNAAPLALCLVFTTWAGCDDRELAVGRWRGAAGGSVGTASPSKPDGTGGGSMVTPGGAGGATGSNGGPVLPPQADCVLPGSMPRRNLGLSGAEVARRLAHLIWQAAPDATLTTRTLTLHTTADVAAVARTMLADPRSADGVRALTRAWLHSDDALTAQARSEAVALATPQLRQSMAFETERFMQDLVAINGGSLRRLLTASDTFVDPALADLYGITRPAAGYAQLTLDPAERSGVLTHAGILFARPFASHRGQWIGQVFLCAEVPLPPAGILPVSLMPGQTYRQALVADMQNPACLPCHRLTDPIGYAFEHYDVLGRFRTTDNDQPVDSATMIAALGGAMVAGARDLGERLADSCQVQNCVASAFLAHAIGRPLLDTDQPQARELAGAFAAAGLDLRELLLAVVQSPAFVKP